jgi:hypothetical protein
MSREALRRIAIHAFHWKDIHRLKDNRRADRVLEDPQKDRIEVIALIHALMLLERDTTAVMIVVNGSCRITDRLSSPRKSYYCGSVWQCQPHIGSPTASG